MARFRRRGLMVSAFPQLALTLALPTVARFRFRQRGGFLTGGILSAGANTSITNSGTIATSGDSAKGIFLFSGANTSITNSGTITTSGVFADGIASGGANTSITNSGRIQVTGTGSIGVNMLGADATLNNGGLISAIGNATQAIVSGTGNDILNLLSGSQIIGTIDLGGGTDVVNISGASTSSTLSILNAEVINFQNGVAGLQVGNVVAVVDPTGQSINSAVLSSLTTGIHGVINQRMAHTKPLKPVQLASLELTPGMLFQERAPQVWGKLFGAHHSRDAEGQVLAYDHNYYGFTGGYERDYNKFRVGIMGGIALARIETDITSIDTDTDSFFAGGYGHFNFGSVNLTTTLIGGYEDHDNDRLVLDNITGFETAKADFDSFFLSPSVTLSAAYDMGNQFEIRPSAMVAYTVAWYDDYSETGTTRSNLSIDDRTVQAFTGRMQLAAAYSLDESREFELRAGLTSRHTNDDNVDANLAGTNFTYAATSDDNVLGAYVGANLRIAVQDRANLLFDIEYGQASGGETTGSGQLGFEFFF